MQQENNMSFFKQFPTISYDFDRNGILQNVVNIYRSVRPLQLFADNFSTYTYYDVKNGERPDVVSQRLYGTTNYYWTFFILNEYLHDGLAAWPMSQEKLQTYMANEYSGIVINTNPQIVRDSDQSITDHRNSLAGRFTLGETITGGISGATGTLVKKDIDLNQLVLENVNGTFVGDGGGVSESLTGSVSNDSVGTYEVFKHLDAPHHYYTTGDAEQRIQTNAVFIEGGVQSGQLSYQTNRSYLEESNDYRSKLRVVDPKYITQFADEFERVLNV